MPKKVAALPKGYRTATASLIVRGADAALDFYSHVFGAEVLSRAYAQDGVTVLQAEMKIGNTIIRVGDEMPAFGMLSPLSLGGSGSAVHLYVEDADTVWNAALDAGASVCVSLADTYWGERFGRLTDPFGHVWSIAQRTEALSPAQVKARAEAWFQPVAVEAAPLETALLETTSVETGAYAVVEAFDAEPTAPEADVDATAAA